MAEIAVSLPLSNFREFPEISASKVFRTPEGAGDGCADFMGAWKNAFFLQEKTHVHKIPLFRGGGFGVLGFLGGGVPILFLWARGFF